MTDRLDTLLADAYDAFATAPPPDLHVCTRPGCCMPAGQMAGMLSGPAAAIKGIDLSYWFNAAESNGPVPHTVSQYLAPRLMETAITRLDPSKPDENLEVARLFSRAPIGEAHRWTEAQNAIIRRFFDGYWETFRSHAQPEPELDEVLCMFTHAGFDIADSLGVLNSWPDAALIDRLWVDCALHMDPPIWESVWWDAPTGRDETFTQQAHQAAQAWYRSDALIQRVDTYLATQDPETPTWKRAVDVEVALRQMRATG